MVLQEALKLYPELIVVPPDHCFHQQKSERLYIAGLYGAALHLKLFDRPGNTCLMKEVDATTYRTRLESTSTVQ